MTRPRLRRRSLGDHLRRRWSGAWPLLALGLAGCTVESLTPGSVQMCVASPRLSDLAYDPEPHAVAWLWPTADGFEVAGQTPLSRAYLEAPACAEVRAPTDAAVLRPEQGRDLWLPWPYPLGAPDGQPMHWRGWAPLVVVYTDVNRSGAFEPAEDTVRQLEPMADQLIEPASVRTFFVPTLPQVLRDPRLAAHLRLFQPRLDAPFLQSDALRLVEPDGRPHTLGGNFDRRCAGVYRGVRCLFDWDAYDHTEYASDEVLAMDATSAAALSQTRPWPAFQLTEAARRLAVQPDDQIATVWRGVDPDGRSPLCLREGRLHIAALAVGHAEADPDACTCRAQTTSVVVLALDPPPPGWPCGPEDYTLQVPLNLFLAAELGTLGARLLLEAAAEVTAQGTAAATPPPTDPPAAGP